MLTTVCVFSLCQVYNSDDIVTLLLSVFGSLFPVITVCNVIVTVHDKLILFHYTSFDNYNNYI